MTEIETLKHINFKKMPPKLFSYHKFWAECFGIAPVLPMSREEMTELGWDSCDIILVTGDAYVDHPSFGMALIGRLLEAQGFRVGIISQPDWKSDEAFKILGKPNLFFGVTSGNMDSMVNHYTADRKIRSNDAFTPNGKGKKRPDRALIVYSQRCREAYSDVPIVVGGIEASLRRIAHYDYWSDKVRHSVLLDSKADLLFYGNADRAIVELAHRLARNEDINTITDIRGSAFCANKKALEDFRKEKDYHNEAIQLPSFERVKENQIAYAQASRQVYLEKNPYNARILVQPHNHKDIWINPPPIPLATEELDYVYELPFSRLPHPGYGENIIPAYEMIRFSVTIMRGCFGGCTFCSLAAHEGRIIQSRSKASILNEIEIIKLKTPGFTGIISDLGGPTANMYQHHCRNKETQSRCRKFSCLYPKPCKNLCADHEPLIQLYQASRQLPKIKKVLVASGVRYDLAVSSPEYVKELASFHVGGYLKIAPEHICAGPLAKMLKPSIDSYDQFKLLFDKYSNQADKKQYLIPYFIAAHPGTTDEDMLQLALWLKKNNFRLDQIQTFLPTPMTLAATMYYTGKNPLHKVTKNSEDVFVPKKLKQRQLHKAFLRYHDPKNWPLLRGVLRQMKREDLIGSAKGCLVPARG